MLNLRRTNPPVVCRGEAMPRWLGPMRSIHLCGHPRGSSGASTARPARPCRFGEKDGSRFEPAIMARSERMRCTKRNAATLGPSSAGLTRGPVCPTKRRNRQTIPRAPEITELLMTLNAALVQNEPTHSVSRKDNTQNVVFHTNGPRFLASRRHAPKRSTAPGWAM